MVNYAHAQTVDTRPPFRGGVWPRDEATVVDNGSYTPLCSDLIVSYTSQQVRIFLH